MTAVPSQYQSLVDSSAAQLGISPAVVAAQIDLESSWNPNATSPTGAQGLAQFEPGTWASYGVGSPTDPTAAMAAYVKYMSALLQQFGGNIHDALAAYNAGPGNLPAGAGYADTIMARAGTGVSTMADGGNIPGAMATAPSDSTCAMPLKFNFPGGSLFNGCLLHKSNVRAFIGGLMIGGGGIVLLSGVYVTMQYGLGVNLPKMHLVKDTIKIAEIAALIPK